MSNTAGTLSDGGFAEAEVLERNTGVKVLRHNTKVCPCLLVSCHLLRQQTEEYKKPGCREEVLEYFRNAPDSNVTSSSQIAVVGDRLFTDVMMANLMGSYGVWVKDGVVEEKNLVRTSISFVSKC